MAELNPNIILSGRNVNPLGAIQQGLNLGQQFRQAPLQNQLLQQRVDQGEQASTINQQQIQKQALERQLFGAQKAILAFDQGNVAGVEDAIREAHPGDMTRQNAEIAEFRLDNLKYMNQAKNDLAAHMSSQQANSSGFQFGAQSTFKDSEDTIFFGTTRRNPNTGKLESVLAAIDGSERKPVGTISQTGAFGQTAAEATDKKITEAGGTTGAKLDVELEKKPELAGSIKTSELEAEAASELGQIKIAQEQRAKEKFTTSKKDKAQKKEEMRLAKQRDAAIVSFDITRALGQAEGLTTTGFTGGIISAVPGTPAFDLKNTLNTIKASIGFGKLQEMRENSPTGGALGQVSENENKLLQSVFGSIEQAQSGPQLSRNLNRMKVLFDAVVNGTTPIPFTQEQFDAIPSGGTYLSPDTGTPHKKP